MKKLLLAFVFGAALSCGFAQAATTPQEQKAAQKVRPAQPARPAPMHDWQVLEKMHKNIRNSITAMKQARTQKHYDKDGHAAKAQKLMEQADEELHLAAESASKSGK